jgi:hypothetical protein
MNGPCCLGLLFSNFDSDAWLWGIICELSTWVQQNFIASTGVYIIALAVKVSQEI